MELLDRELNIIAHDTNRGKRKSALDKLATTLQNSSDAFTKDDIAKMLPTAVKALEDSSESCRSAAIALVTAMLPHLGDDGPVWIFPAIAARMEPANAASNGYEPSEDIRLELYQLAAKALAQWRHDVGPRGFIKQIGGILAGALRDKFPDLLKAACAGCIELCRAEPKGVKEVAVALARLVKAHCLQHKHMSVREEAVRALATLIRHGAVELLADAKDELENRTTVFYIYVLAHDRSDSVRLETLRLLETCLTDISDRLEQHRRLVPIVLALLTDSGEAIRRGAAELMHQLGNIYTRVDHEDNRIDIDRRRVTVKDIEWYADDPDNYAEKMSTWTYTSHFQALPSMRLRPPLGDRLVVAEAVRHFLDKQLTDLTGVEWLIPFSTVSRRLAALRVLTATFWHTEDNIVQHLQPVLGALFKTLLHEDKAVRAESMHCVEMLGKFVRPESYIEILLRKPPAGSSDAAAALVGGKAATATTTDGAPAASSSVVRKGTTTVTTTVCDADAVPNSAPLPTLYQTAAAATKRGILVALHCLLTGVGRFFVSACGGGAAGDKAVAQRNAKDLVTALSNPDLVDLDQPLLVQAHSDAIDSVIVILVECKFCPSHPSNPLPAEMLADPNKSTLDSVLLTTLLGNLSCPNLDVVKHVRGVIQRGSVRISGSESGWFDMHCHRILHKRAAALSPEAFAELMDRTADVSGLGEVLTNMFVARLQSVNYSLRVVGELKLFTELRKVLAHGVGAAAAQQKHEDAAQNSIGGGAAAAASKDAAASASAVGVVVKPVHFTPAQLDLLLRAVILQHLKFVVGPTAHLFRKVALQCLREVLRPARRRMLKAQLAAPAEAPSGDPRDPPPDPLSERLASSWHSMIDNDDSECRVTAAEMIYDVCMLDLSAGMAAAVLDGTLGRLDDSSDAIRLVALQQLYAVLMTSDDDVSRAFVATVTAKLPEMAKVCMIHMDDFRESVGVKPLCRDVLKRMKGINAKLVDDMARAKMAVPTYSNRQALQEILDFHVNS